MGLGFVFFLDVDAVVPAVFETWPSLVIPQRREAGSPAFYVGSINAPGQISVDSASRKLAQGARCSFRGRRLGVHVNRLFQFDSRALHVLQLLVGHSQVEA